MTDSLDMFEPLRPDEISSAGTAREVVPSNDASFEPVVPPPDAAPPPPAHPSLGMPTTRYAYPNAAGELEGSSASPRAGGTP